MEKFTNEKLNEKLAKCEALSPAYIADNGISKKDVALYLKLVKEKKAQKKVEALKLDKCLIMYNGQAINFKPSLTTVDGKDVVIWKALDKNACYVAQEKDGLVDVKAVPACSSRSQNYDLRKKEVENNKKLVNGLINQVFTNMNWAAFIERVKGYKNIKTVNTPAYLK